MVIIPKTTSPMKSPMTWSLMTRSPRRSPGVIFRGCENFCTPHADTVAKLVTEFSARERPANQPTHRESRHQYLCTHSHLSCTALAFRSVVGARIRPHSRYSPSAGASETGLGRPAGVGQPPHYVHQHNAARDRGGGPKFTTKTSIRQNFRTPHADIVAKLVTEFSARERPARRPTRR